MKIAIPLFGSWVSPRFGYSSEVWVLNVKDSEVVSQKTVSMVGMPLPFWLSQFAYLGIDVLICGGIDQASHRKLEYLGISVMPEIAGDAIEVLELFLAGKLEPGFRKCKRKSRGFKGKKGRYIEQHWTVDDKK
ncbi:MAG: NifB/NifX family molybdenum-iron cluster-binding protein [Thermodesulfobacteriota bacterium]|nr:NifB/NifX family molybdenum-iron cluster-binding protein [Thermodesulfobacteriota bacterium]